LYTGSWCSSFHVLQALIVFMRTSGDSMPRVCNKKKKKKENNLLICFIYFACPYNHVIIVHGEQVVKVGHSPLDHVYRGDQR